jgi:hypothetical protein
MTCSLVVKVQMFCCKQLPPSLVSLFCSKGGGSWFLWHSIQVHPIKFWENAHHYKTLRSDNKYFVFIIMSLDYVTMVGKCSSVGSDHVRLLCYNSSHLIVEADYLLTRNRRRGEKLLWGQKLAMSE